ncbi:MAG: hypothetical protein HOI65_14500 [Opitutae bacterium]|nr:hypothetical protein [Opitutae bacterium]
MNGAITPLMTEALTMIVEGGSVKPPSFNIGDDVVEPDDQGGVVVSRHYVDHRWVYQIRSSDETHWMGQGKLKLAE